MIFFLFEKATLSSQYWLRINFLHQNILTFAKTVKYGFSTWFESQPLIVLLLHTKFTVDKCDILFIKCTIASVYSCFTINFQLSLIVHNWMSVYCPADSKNRLWALHYTCTWLFYTLLLLTVSMQGVLTLAVCLLYWTLLLIKLKKRIWSRF